MISEIFYKLFLYVNLGLVGLSFITEEPYICVAVMTIGIYLFDNYISFLYIYTFKQYL